MPDKISYLELKKQDLSAFEIYNLSQSKGDEIIPPSRSEFDKEFADIKMTPEQADANYQFVQDDYNNYASTHWDGKINEAYAQFGERSVYAGEMNPKGINFGSRYVNGMEVKAPSESVNDYTYKSLSNYEAFDEKTQMYQKFKVPDMNNQSGIVMHGDKPGYLYSIPEFDESGAIKNYRKVWQPEDNLLGVGERLVETSGTVNSAAGVINYGANRLTSLLGYGAELAYGFAKIVDTDNLMTDYSYDNKIKKDRAIETGDPLAKYGRYESDPILNNIIKFQNKWDYANKYKFSDELMNVPMFSSPAAFMAQNMETIIDMIPQIGIAYLSGGTSILTNMASKGTNVLLSSILKKEAIDLSKTAMVKGLGMATTEFAAIGTLQATRSNIMEMRQNGVSEDDAIKISLITSPAVFATEKFIAAIPMLSNRFGITESQVTKALRGYYGKFIAKELQNAPSLSKSDAGIKMLQNKFLNSVYKTLGKTTGVVKYASETLDNFETAFANGLIGKAGQFINPGAMLKSGIAEGTQETLEQWIYNTAYYVHDNYGPGKGLLQGQGSMGYKELMSDVIGMKGGFGDNFGASFIIGSMFGGIGGRNKNKVTPTNFEYVAALTGQTKKYEDELTNLAYKTNSAEFGSQKHGIDGNVLMADNEYEGQIEINEETAKTIPGFLDGTEVRSDLVFPPKEGSKDTAKRIVLRSAADINYYNAIQQLRIAEFEVQQAGFNAEKMKNYDGLQMLAVNAVKTYNEYLSIKKEIDENSELLKDESKSEAEKKAINDKNVELESKAKKALDDYKYYTESTSLGSDGKESPYSDAYRYTAQKAIAATAIVDKEVFDSLGYDLTKKGEWTEEQILNYNSRRALLLTELGRDFYKQVISVDQKAKKYLSDVQSVLEKYDNQVKENSQLNTDFQSQVSDIISQLKVKGGENFDAHNKRVKALVTPILQKGLGEGASIEINKVYNDLLTELDSIQNNTTKAYNFESTKVNLESLQEKVDDGTISPEEMIRYDELSSSIKEQQQSINDLGYSEFDPEMIDAANANADLFREQLTSAKEVAGKRQGEFAKIEKYKSMTDDQIMDESYFDETLKAIDVAKTYLASLDSENAVPGMNVSDIHTALVDAIKMNSKVKYQIELRKNVNTKLRKDKKTKNIIESDKRSISDSDYERLSAKAKEVEDALKEVAGPISNLVGEDAKTPLRIRMREANHKYYFLQTIYQYDQLAKEYPDLAKMVNELDEVSEEEIEADGKFEDEFIKNFENYEKQLNTIFDYLHSKAKTVFTKDLVKGLMESTLLQEAFDSVNSRYYGNSNRFADENISRNSKYDGQKDVTSQVEYSTFDSEQGPRMSYSYQHFCNMLVKVYGNNNKEVNDTRLSLYDNDSKVGISSVEQFEVQDMMNAFLNGGSEMMNMIFDIEKQIHGERKNELGIYENYINNAIFVAGKYGTGKTTYVVNQFIETYLTMNKDSKFVVCGFNTNNLETIKESLAGVISKFGGRIRFELVENIIAGKGNIVKGENIIIDEATLLTEGDQNYLRDNIIGVDNKVVLLGDTQQLPTINNNLTSTDNVIYKRTMFVAPLQQRYSSEIPAIDILADSYFLAQLTPSMLPAAFNYMDNGTKIGTKYSNSVLDLVDDFLTAMQTENNSKEIALTVMNKEHYEELLKERPNLSKYVGSIYYIANDFSVKDPYGIQSIQGNRVSQQYLAFDFFNKEFVAKYLPNYNSLKTKIMYTMIGRSKHFVQIVGDKNNITYDKPISFNRSKGMNVSNLYDKKVQTIQSIKNTKSTYSQPKKTTTAKKEEVVETVDEVVNDNVKTYAGTSKYGKVVEVKVETNEDGSRDFNNIHVEDTNTDSDLDVLKKLYPEVAEFSEKEKEVVVPVKETTSSFPEYGNAKVNTRYTNNSVSLIVTDIFKENGKYKVRVLDERGEDFVMDYTTFKKYYKEIGVDNIPGEETQVEQNDRLFKKSGEVFKQTKKMPVNLATMFFSEEHKYSKAFNNKIRALKQVLLQSNMVDMKMVYSQKTTIIDGDTETENTTKVSKNDLWGKLTIKAGYTEKLIDFIKNSDVDQEVKTEMIALIKSNKGLPDILAYAFTFYQAEKSQRNDDGTLNTIRDEEYDGDLQLIYNSIESGFGKSDMAAENNKTLNKTRASIIHDFRKRSNETGQNEIEVGTISDTFIVGTSTKLNNVGDAKSNASEVIKEAEQKGFTFTGVIKAARNINKGTNGITYYYAELKNMLSNAITKVVLSPLSITDFIQSNKDQYKKQYVNNILDTLEQDFISFSDAKTLSKIGSLKPNLYIYRFLMMNYDQISKVNPFKKNIIIHNNGRELSIVGKTIAEQYKNFQELTKQFTEIIENLGKTNQIDIQFKDYRFPINGGSNYGNELSELDQTNVVEVHTPYAYMEVKNIAENKNGENTVADKPAEVKKSKFSGLGKKRNELQTTPKIAASQALAETIIKNIAGDAFFEANTFFSPELLTEDGRKLWGRMIDGSVYYELKNGTVNKPTIRHELFHTVWNYMLDQKAKESIILDMEKQGFKRKDVEEELAKRYGSYNGRSNYNEKKGIVQKFFRLLDRIISLFNKPTTEIEKLFMDIEQGMYKQGFKDIVSNSVSDENIVRNDLQDEEGNPVGEHEEVNLQEIQEHKELITALGNERNVIMLKHNIAESLMQFCNLSGHLDQGNILSSIIELKENILSAENVKATTDAYNSLVQQLGYQITGNNIHLLTDEQFEVYTDYLISKKEILEPLISLNFKSFNHRKNSFGKYSKSSQYDLKSNTSLTKISTDVFRWFMGSIPLKQYVDGQWQQTTNFVTYSNLTYELRTIAPKIKDAIRIDKNTDIRTEFMNELELMINQTNGARRDILKSFYDYMKEGKLGVGVSGLIDQYESGELVPANNTEFSSIQDIDNFVTAMFINLINTANTNSVSFKSEKNENGTFIDVKHYTKNNFESIKNSIKDHIYLKMKNGYGGINKNFLNTFLVNGDNYSKEILDKTKVKYNLTKDGITTNKGVKIISKVNGRYQLSKDIRLAHVTGMLSTLGFPKGSGINTIINKLYRDGNGSNILTTEAKIALNNDKNTQVKKTVELTSNEFLANTIMAMAIGTYNMYDNYDHGNQLTFAAETKQLMSLLNVKDSQVDTINEEKEVNGKKVSEKVKVYNPNTFYPLYNAWARMIESYNPIGYDKFYYDAEGNKIYSYQRTNSIYNLFGRFSEDDGSWEKFVEKVLEEVRNGNVDSSLLDSTGAINSMIYNGNIKILGISESTGLKSEYRGTTNPVSYDLFKMIEATMLDSVVSGKSQNIFSIPIVFSSSGKYYIIKMELKSPPFSIDLDSKGNIKAVDPINEFVTKSILVNFRRYNTNMNRSVNKWKSFFQTQVGKSVYSKLQSSQVPSEMTVKKMFGEKANDNFDPLFLRKQGVIDLDLRQRDAIISNPNFVKGFDYVIKEVENEDKTKTYKLSFGNATMFHVTGFESIYNFKNYQDIKSYNPDKAKFSNDHITLKAKFDKMFSPRLKMFGDTLNKMNSMSRSDSDNKFIHTRDAGKLLTDTEKGKFYKYDEDGNLIANDYYKALWFAYHSLSSQINPLLFGDEQIATDPIDFAKRINPTKTPVTNPDISKRNSLAPSSEMVVFKDFEEKVTYGSKEYSVAPFNGQAIGFVVYEQAFMNSVGGYEYSEIDKAMHKTLNNGDASRTLVSTQIKFATDYYSDDLIESNFKLKKVQLNLLKIMNSRISDAISQAREEGMNRLSDFNAEEIFMKYYASTGSFTKASKMLWKEMCDYDFFNETNNLIKSKLMYGAISDEAIKKGMHGVNSIDLSQEVDHKNVQTTMFDNTTVGIVNNPHQETTSDASQSRPNQAIEQVISGENNKDIKEAVIDANTKIYNTQMDKLFGEMKIDRNKEVWSNEDFEKFASYLTSLGEKQAERIGGSGMIDMIHKGVTVQDPILRSMLTTLWRNTIKKQAIQPKWKGNRSAQSSGYYIEHYVVNGVKYTAAEIFRDNGIEPHEIEKQANILKMFPAAALEDMSNNNGEFKEAEVVMEYIYKKEFGIKENETLNDVFTITYTDSKGIVQRWNSRLFVEDAMNGDEKTKPKAQNILARKIDDILKNGKVHDTITPSMRGRGDITTKSILTYLTNFERSLHVVATRVPFDSPKLGFAAKIVSFSGGNGNTIYIPPTANVRTGGDQDIDQLSIYFHQLDSNGARPEETNKDLKTEFQQNRIFDSLRLFYSKESNNHRVYSETTPDRLTKIADKKSKPVRTITDIDKDQNDIAYNDLGSFLNLHDIINDGEDSIDIYASMASSIARLSTIAGTITLPNGTKVNLDRVFDKKGDDSIVNTIGTLLQSALDNEKYLALGRLNISKDYAGAAIAMAVQGKSIDDIADFFGEYIVRKTSKQFKNKTRVMDNEFGDVGTIAILEHKQHLRDKINEFKIGNTNEYNWSRESKNSYEVSSAGDNRFSALYAKLKDGRTIEEAYQLDIKGYRIQGNDWKLGKGKKPLSNISTKESWNQYKELWRTYLNENPELKQELLIKAKGKVLTDKFANTNVSQARALAEILSEENPNKKVSQRIMYDETILQMKKDKIAEYEPLWRENNKMIDNAQLDSSIDPQKYIDDNNRIDRELDELNMLANSIKNENKLDELYNHFIIGQALFRFGRFVSLRNGFGIRDYELKNNVRNFEDFLGHSLSILSENREVSINEKMKWFKEHNNTYLKYLGEDNESKVKYPDNPEKHSNKADMYAQIQKDTYNAMNLTEVVNSMPDISSLVKMMMDEHNTINPDFNPFYGTNHKIFSEIEKELCSGQLYDTFRSEREQIIFDNVKYAAALDYYYKNNHFEGKAKRIDISGVTYDENGNVSKNSSLMVSNLNLANTKHRKLFEKAFPDYVEFLLDLQKKNDSELAKVFDELGWDSNTIESVRNNKFLENLSVFGEGNYKRVGVNPAVNYTEELLKLATEDFLKLPAQVQDIFKHYNIISELSGRGSKSLTNLVGPELRADVSRSVPKFKTYLDGLTGIERDRFKEIISSKMGTERDFTKKGNTESRKKFITQVDSNNGRFLEHQKVKDNANRYSIVQPNISGTHIDLNDISSLTSINSSVSLSPSEAEQMISSKYVTVEFEAASTYTRGINNVITDFGEVVSVNSVSNNGKTVTFESNTDAKLNIMQEPDTRKFCQ